MFELLLDLVPANGLVATARHKGHGQGHGQPTKQVGKTEKHAAPCSSPGIQVKSVLDTTPLVSLLASSNLLVPFARCRTLDAASGPKRCQLLRPW